MTVLALDVGDRRIGVAVSDPTELLARPVRVIYRRSNEQDFAAIREVAIAEQVRLILVGLPVSTDDTIGRQGKQTLAFTRRLRRALALPVELWDERYSTQDAQQALKAAGARRTRQREPVDAVAAAVILDDWLTSHRRPSPTQCHSQND